MFVDEGEWLDDEAAASAEDDGLCLGGWVEDALIGSPNAKAAALA